MRLVIIGGHLAPAISIIEELPKDTKILFVGRKYTFEGEKTTSLEFKTIISKHIPFVNLTTGRLQRKFTVHTIPSLIKIPYGFIQAFSILNSFKPDVVLGFGGYLSVPVIIAAFLLRIPVVIHEQTFAAGLANKIASNFSDKICISYESSRKFFRKEKTVLTGNPIRNFQLSLLEAKRRSNLLIQEIAALPSVARNDRPIIYITGGSSGSHFINIMIEGSIKELLKHFIVIHQTGDSQKYQDFDRLQNLRDSFPKELKDRYVLKKFIDFEDVGLVLNKSDLVVSRAGINTVNELINFQKPALLIPITFSQNNEQFKNALYFKSLGLGEIAKQNSLDSSLLLQKIREMVNNIDRYKLDKSKIVLTANASQKIIDILEYVKNKKKN